ncbi:virulence RhuM family protein [Ruegeria sp.]|uniref:virulence RhuM family protein n=1 Tax=Ruegeria sp. TaxID=1879320 RepID=UPI003AFFB682
MKEAPETPAGELLLYETEDGRARVECRFLDESLWLSQALIAELYAVSVKTVNEHLANIHAEGELAPEATIRKFRIVRQEGTRQVARTIEHYNLDAILAVGYRVRSGRGVQFRRWATERLREYLVKGFTMDDERLKNTPADMTGIPDYFDELLERIRDIRASEARVYLRVREIFALAADYRSDAKDSATFFKIMQNKLHFAVTGKTAAELIHSRANRKQPAMGLTTYKGADVRKADVVIAKNYLNHQEISDLNRIVTMWLDYAEDQSARRKQIFMGDWEEKLNSFLSFNDRDLLPDAGKVSHRAAKRHAEVEYDAYATERRRLKEAQGLDASLRALQDTAKALDAKPRQARGRIGKDGPEKKDRQ